MKEVCERLKALREKSGMNNNDLADSSGVPAATVKRVLAGQTDNPTFQTIRDLTYAMGGSLDWVAGRQMPEADQESDAEPGARSDDGAKEQIVRLYQKSIISKNSWLRKLFIWNCVLFATLVVIVVFGLVIPHLGYGPG